MVDFTLFELHFEDSDLTANAPYSYGKKDVVPGEEPEEGASSGKGKLFALLVGLAFSIAVAYLARKKVFSGDDIEAEEGSKLRLRA